MKDNASQVTEAAALLGNEASPPRYSSPFSFHSSKRQHITDTRNQSTAENNPKNTLPPISPVVRGAFGAVSSMSGYGRGLVNMARFFMLWHFCRIMTGERITAFEVPSSFTLISLAIAPFLAVDWVVNGYNHSLEFVTAYQNKQKKKVNDRSGYIVIGKVLRKNIPAIPIALIGAVGHSFVVHRGIRELGSSFSDQGAGATAFEALSWLFPAFCALQYLLSEGQHIAHALKRPLIFEDYRDGMRFKGMSRVQQLCFIVSTNAVAMLTAFFWGALEFTESYLVLRKALESRQVGLGNEIAFMVACFFCVLGAVNSFIADGERFRSFMTHPYREPYREPDSEDESDEPSRLSTKKEIIGLPPRKIPRLSTIFCSRYSVPLLLTGLPSLISSAGLGVVSFTGTMQFANVFVQFHDSTKPLWAPWWMLLTMGMASGVLPATVFFITKGRYIWKAWRHADADVHQESDADCYQDRRDHEKREIRYRLEHISLDCLQFVLILSIKLIVEFTASIRLSFLSEIAVFYLTALVAALIPFGIEEVSKVNKPVKFGDTQKTRITARRVVQSLAQVGIPLGVGVFSEWLLHKWVISEPVSESSRLGFAHVAGTIMTGLLAVLVKRGVDYGFAKVPPFFSRCIEANKKANDQSSQEFNPVPIVMMCFVCSFFAGLLGGGISSVVGFFGHQPTMDPDDGTVMDGFFTGVGMTTGFYLLLCAASCTVRLCRTICRDDVGEENRPYLAKTF